jgi:hypothetical protein
VMLGKWTGEEEIELVGLGEGTFQKERALYAGYGNLVRPFSTSGVEESWEVMVDMEKREGLETWKAPKVVGVEVKYKQE